MTARSPATRRSPLTDGLAETLRLPFEANPWRRSLRVGCPIPLTPVRRCTARVRPGTTLYAPGTPLYAPGGYDFRETGKGHDDD